MVALPPVTLDSLAAALFLFFLSPESLPGPRGPPTEEVGQVANQATVEGVAGALAEVGNAVRGEELPGGSVAGHQVEVRGQEQASHQREDGQQQEGGKQEPAGPQP